LLEETPYFWEAQEMLLRIVEEDSDSQVSQLPEAAVLGTGEFTQEK
jgi:hypothetical protein